jgi:hypothetical protein
MPAKPKASAKVGAKAKREAIAKALPGVKVYPENMDFLYRRRHLATVRDGKSRELQYIVEFDELEQAIWKALDRICKRDGIKIGKRKLANQQIDFGQIKARHRNVEIDFEFGEVLQLDSEQSPVPAGVFRKPVISDNVSANLGLAHGRQAHGRDLIKTDDFGGFDAAVAGNDAVGVIDQGVFRHGIRTPFSG